MKRLIWVASIIVCLAALSLTGLHAETTKASGTSESPPAESSAAAAQPSDAGQAPSMSGCPGMQGMPMKGHGKRYGTGCGMMQMRGCGMGHGYGMIHDCPCPRCGCQGRMEMNPASPLTLDDAKAMVEGRLAFMGNPNLKMGDVTDQGSHFEAVIQTQEGSLVDKLIIHKIMGWMRSIY